MAPFAWQAWEQWQQALDLATRAENLARKADDEATVAKRKSNAAEGAAKETQAQIDALIKFREFEKMAASSRPIMESVSIMQMLPEVRPYEEKRLVQAVADCRRSLHFYRVLEDAEWQRQPAVRDLPPRERDRLRRKVAELLCGVVHEEQANFARLNDQTRSCEVAIAASTLPGLGCEIRGAYEATLWARIKSAARWNELACACFDGQTVPRYLMHQKAGLTHLQGDPGEADRLGALAEKLPWSDELDERCWAASTLIASGKFKHAQPLLLDATERSPSHAWAQLLLAWCCNNAEDSPKAKSHYE
jgi:hypothetical protein